MLQAQGLFWTPDPPKTPDEKRVPPAPVWLSPTYLPGLEEARAFNPPWLTMEDLLAEQAAGNQLILDLETYPNYFLAALTSFVTGKVIWFEMYDDGNGLRHADCLDWILNNFQIVTFNGNKFDIPIVSLALAGKTCAEIVHATTMLIQMEIQPWQVLKSFKVECMEIDHIDLFSVCPLNSGASHTSLKTYGGRLHVPLMKELPFQPGVALTPDQITIMRWYCVNDLTCTCFLLAELQEQIAIRVAMSAEYGVDLRSKSDAQVAEAVIKAEFERMTGFKPERPEIEPGTTYMYHVPPFISFRTPGMIAALDTIRAVRFVVDDSGSIEMPEALQNLQIQIGRGTYTLGIGGLHSTEKVSAHRATAEFRLVDRDVTSYYPSIILNQGLAPSHLGADFLLVYRSLVERRIAAKVNPENIAAGTANKVVADMLKIVINGSFGKLGNKWSILYAPDLMIQTTLTGQLSILMLIESLELAGIEVVSANTDGVISKYPRVMEETAAAVVRHWEQTTSFGTEATDYLATYSRDVNSYIAVKDKLGKDSAPFLDHRLGMKTKGAYCERGSAGDSVLSKNPEALICADAVLHYLRNGTPLGETIRACRDIRRFVTIRNVKGGGAKDGVYLGKVVRWYYPINGGGEIVYCSSGSKVAKSEGARPVMELPKEFPPDVDFARYEAMAFEMLREIGALNIA